jgi:hypothetical protein
MTVHRRVSGSALRTDRTPQHRHAPREQGEKQIQEHMRM